jgi:TonB-dependent starch-binding outer membrane protein SusC
MLMLGMLLISSQLLAQTRTVTGRVVDVAGVPIPGASVQVRGTNAGTITGPDGTFTINLPSNANTLVITGTQLTRQEIGVSPNQTTVNVTMQAAERSLQEVVVTGYATQRRREVTGSVDRISAREIENLPLTSPDQALQGRAAGVTVTNNSGTPGASINVNIRGIGSISASSQPLYIVDGIPINTGSFSQIGVGGQTLNRMVDLNPNEIESFEILKDAAATAVYGARASNGVVLITTKRGRNQRTKINVSSSYGTQRPWRKIETITGPEYIELVQEGVKARFGANIVPSQLGLTGLDAAPSTYPTTNWQDLIFRSASIAQHDISATGGNERTRFYVGGGYFEQQGIIIGSSFRRYNFRINLDNNITDKFKISTGLSGSRNHTSRTNNDNNIYGVLSTAVLNGSYYNPYNAAGQYVRDPNSSIENPLLSANEIYNRANNNRVLGNLAAEYQILPSLSFRSTFGIDYTQLNELQFFPSISAAGAGTNGQANEGYQNSTNLINENILNYTQRFGEHNLTLIGVASYQTTRFESIFGQALQFPGNQIRRLSAGATKSILTSDENAQGIIGYVGRANYNFKGRYLFSASVRRDGISNFGANRRWGTFPAFSAGWIISDEEFMRGQRTFTNLKIRGSYGITGNAQGIGLFASRALVGAGASYLASAPGLAPSQLGNPNLSWEEARQADIALEVGFLNRFNLTLEGYKKNTTNLLLARPLVGSSGFTTVTQNVGELENMGLEIQLNSRNINNRDFSWTTDFNVTFQQTIVKRLFDGVPFAAGFASWVQEGESIGSFRGYRVVGIFQNQAEIDAAPVHTTHPTNPLLRTQPGDIRFADLNNDGRITTDDQQILGNAIPKFFGGITNTLTYKGFELNAFVQFVSGNKIYNNTRAFSEGMNSVFGQTVAVRDRWQPGKPSTTMPRAVFGDPSNNRRNSDRWLEDGSYLRLKNVVLSYGLPAVITNRLHVSSFRVFVQGQNLLTATRYKGFDPEVSTFSTTNTAPGTDFLTFPQARTITFGLNVGF